MGVVESPEKVLEFFVSKRLGTLIELNSVGKLFQN